MTYKLVKVVPQYYNSIKKYREEMLSCGSSFDGCFYLDEYEDIEKWHLNNVLFESKDTLPPGYSIGYQYLYLDDDEVVGLVNVRTEALSHPYLKLYGGHIGYSVKPSKRNKGIANSMLKDVLDICRDEYHLDLVLITCFKDNLASKKVITNNGGILENELIYPPENKTMLRYWIKLQ